jgi:hypothetical protein
MGQQQDRERPPLQWETIKEFKEQTPGCEVTSRVQRAGYRYSLQIGVPRAADDRLSSFIPMRLQRTSIGEAVALDGDVAEAICRVTMDAKNFILAEEQRRRDEQIDRMRERDQHNPHERPMRHTGKTERKRLRRNRPPGES